MREQGYTAAELRAVRRVLEDMELGRWPARAVRPAELEEPAVVAALWRAGEVVRAVEERVRAQGAAAPHSAVGPQVVVETSGDVAA